jgi:hypothetical protein
MPYADFAPILKKLRSSSFQGTLVSGLNEILLLNQRNDYNFTFNFCKERVVGISIVIYFRKHFYLIPALNSILRNLVSSGIAEHLHKRYLDENILSVKKDANGPKALNFNLTTGCFQILFFGCALSFVCFISELIRGFLITKFKCSKVNQVHFEFIH